MAKVKKIRPMGEIRCELEELYDEIIDTHDQQIGDEVGWLHEHLKMHRPDAMEEFTDNTRPVFFYGHERDLLRLAVDIAKRRKNERAVAEARVKKNSKNVGSGRRSNSTSARNKRK